MKILVADDSLAIFERLTELLAPLCGVEIVGQRMNAESALHGVLETRPDVVILDLHMPGGSGFDLLKRIKKIAPGTTVIVLTNYAYQQYRALCMRLGADAFLDKSTEFEKIPDLIRMWEGKLRLKPAV